MKSISRYVSFALLTAMATFCLADPPPDAGSTIPIPTVPTLPSTTDLGTNLGTNLVVKFYGALLQQEPPTREQELEIFDPSCSIRTRLVIGEGDPRDAIKPMNRTAEDRARRRLQDEKVAAAGPVVLTYFRTHKDWFLPKNMRSVGEIQVSSTFNMVCSLEYAKAPPTPGYGWVMALFADDRKAAPDQGHTRIIVFGLRGGRIHASNIRIDGSLGKMTEELFYNEDEAGRNRLGP